MLVESEGYRVCIREEQDRLPQSPPIFAEYFSVSIFPISFQLILIGMKLDSSQLILIGKKYF